MRITKDTTVSELMHGDNLAYIDLDEDEVMHWKYLKKKKLPNGKWRYYYDLDSLKKDIKSSVDNVTKKTSSAVKSGKRAIQKYAKTIKDASVKMVSDIKSTIAKAKKNIHKYIAKIPTDSGTYRYFYSDKAYQAYLKGKNAADKVLDKNVNATASDTAKANAKAFVANTLFGSFGQAVYNVVAPALTAIQVALTTPKSFSELKKFDKEQSNEEHEKAVNPNHEYGTKYDYSMNCSFCTAAYDLRKRGYDVEANPISAVEAYTIYDIKDWYKDAKVVSKQDVLLRTDPNKPASDAKRLEESLKKNGEGARGHLALYWRDGGGHDIVWEIQNGEVVLRDSQTRITKTLEEYLDPDLTSSYDYMRVDNLEPTEEVLRTVRNRKTR